MKNLFFKTVFLLSFMSVTSCAVEKTVPMADGSYITERKHKRILKQVYRETMRKMNKDEKKIIKSSNFKVVSE